jgi:hypothetical protein
MEKQYTAREKQLGKQLGQALKMMRPIFLCTEVAERIWLTKEPSPIYKKSVRNLLLGTAAQESNFRWRRQHGFDSHSSRGAFSLWQMEINSIKNSIKMINSKDALFDRCYGFFKDLNIVVPDNLEEILLFLQTKEGDALGCVLCRLHYIRCPGFIPDTINGQAEYWKKYYNTYLGKGTTEQYLKNWNGLVKPFLKD